MTRRSAAVLAGFLVLATAAFAFSGAAFWPFAGQNLSNTRSADAAVMIDAGNVGSLGVQWVFQAGADVTATPSVDATSVYVPDWDGNLFSLDRRTGALNWSRQISEYTGAVGDFSRTTPAIHGNNLIFGNQGGRLFQGATLVAVNRQNGNEAWSTQLDAHPAAIITQSPVVFGNTIFVGLASMEEAFATDPGYPCCSFRGSLAAVDANTGELLWKTYMVPDIPGYSGGAIWGSNAAVDPASNTVYVTTGNNYSVPDDDLACVAANEGDPDAVADCLPPDNYFDAVVALDMTTGAPKWHAKALPFDSWTVACLFGLPYNCDTPTGPDLDFGQGPALFTVMSDGGMPRKLVGAGQKSGQYWVFDAESGELEWVTQAGPGGVLGGMMWGSAVDGDRIYTGNANAFFQPWGLVGGVEVNYGFWSAMDARTGEILWQTPDPIPFNTNQAPVTEANGVVYACSMDEDGHMYALDASNGQVLWSFASGGSCNAGAAVVDGQVFWGSGYAALAGFLPGAGPNDKLYAFSLQ